MNNKFWIAIGALILVVIFTAIQLAGALGRISVLMEQADSAEVVTAAAIAGEVQARDSMAIAFAEAEEERVEAVAEIAEAHAETIVQQAEAETAFRRAEGLASENPVLERAIQEMRAEGIVTEMRLEEEVATTAVALFAAQLRIGTLERLSGEKDDATDRMAAAFRAEVSIKDQIIVEQQRALAPSFIQKLFAMPEVALVGVVAGIVGCVALCP